MQIADHDGRVGDIGSDTNRQVRADMGHWPFATAPGHDLDRLAMQRMQGRGQEPVDFAAKRLGVKFIQQRQENAEIPGQRTVQAVGPRP